MAEKGQTEAKTPTRLPMKLEKGERKKKGIMTTPMSTVKISRTL